MLLRSTRASLIGAAGAAIALVACGSGGLPGPSPSSTFPSPSTPAPTISASGTPVGVPVHVRIGKASVKVRGGVTRRLHLSLAPSAVYQPPPGQFSLSFIDRSGNALIVNGATPSRTVRTSTGLTLTVVVQTSRALVFASAKGECTISVRGSSAARLAAGFSCRNLSAGHKTIRATGTFDARR